MSNTAGVIARRLRWKGSIENSGWRQVSIPGADSKLLLRAARQSVDSRSVPDPEFSADRSSICKCVSAVDSPRSNVEKCECLISASCSVFAKD
jgi:hypothetical protein